MAFGTGEGSSPSSADMRALWLPLPGLSVRLSMHCLCTYTRVHTHGRPARAGQAGHGTQGISPEHRQHRQPDPDSPLQLIRIDVC